MYVCMCACVPVCMCLCGCVYVCMCVCVYVYVCTYMSTHTYMHVYVYMYVYLDKCMYMRRSENCTSRVDVFFDFAQVSILGLGLGGANNFLLSCILFHCPCLYFFDATLLTFSSMLHLLICSSNF